MTEERLLTIKEVADVLRLNPETVRRWVRAGKIRGILMGSDKGGYRISSSEVERIRTAGPREP